MSLLGFGGDALTAKGMIQDKEISESQQETMLAQSMLNAGQVSMDTQVSALILEMKQRFLKYKIIKNDGEEPFALCVETYPYLEPWGEESRCFLEGNYPKLVGEIDMLLSELYNYSERYDEDMSGAFNELVRVRHSILGLSRATGKAAKVAKSQFVESSANIRRDIMNKQKDKGLLGLGFFGL